MRHRISLLKEGQRDLLPCGLYQSGPQQDCPVETLQGFLTGRVRCTRDSLGGGGATRTGTLMDMVCMYNMRPHGPTPALCVQTIVAADRSYHSIPPSPPHLTSCLTSTYVHTPTRIRGSIQQLSPVTHEVQSQDRLESTFRRCSQTDVPKGNDLFHAGDLRWSTQGFELRRVPLAYLSLRCATAARANIGKAEPGV
jgi:hypothetical protein